MHTSSSPNSDAPVLQTPSPSTFISYRGTSDYSDSCEYCRSPSALLQHVPSLRWKSTANSFVLPLGCRGPRSRTPWLPAGCGHRTRLWNAPLISLSSRSHAVTGVRWPWDPNLMDALIPFCSCVSLTQLCLLTSNATMQRCLHQLDANVVRAAPCFNSPTCAHASSAASITSYGPSGAHGLCKRRPSTD